MTELGRWRRRIVFGVVVWLVAWAFAAFLGSSPQPMLLAAVTMSVCTVGGVVADAWAGISRADWAPGHRSSPRQGGADPRFSRLAHSFTDGTDPQVVAEQVHESLCSVVDGLLLSRHSTDRQRDPEIARRALGDELADYLERPPRYSRGYFQKLPTLLTRMESL